MPRLTPEQAQAVDFRVAIRGTHTNEQLRILDLLDEVKAMKKKAPNWAHLSAISNFTEGCECSICTGEMLLESCKVHELQKRLEQAERERDEAREWVRKMHRDAQVLTCAFCGESYPPGTPNSGSEALTAHIKVCAKHPMREVERARDEARADCTVLKAEVLASRQRCTDRKQRSVMEPGARCGYGHPADPMMAGQKCPVCAAMEATDASGALNRGGGE